MVLSINIFQLIIDKTIIFFRLFIVFSCK